MSLGCGLQDWVEEVLGEASSGKLRETPEGDGYVIRPFIRLGFLGPAVCFFFSGQPRLSSRRVVRCSFLLFAFPQSVCATNQLYKLHKFLLV